MWVTLSTTMRTLELFEMGGFVRPSTLCTNTDLPTPAAPRMAMLNVSMADDGVLFWRGKDARLASDSMGIASVDDVIKELNLLEQGYAVMKPR